MRVGLFPTCLVEASVPAVALAAKTLLEQQGHEVFLLEAATCCGQPAWNSGQRRAARTVAATSMRAFAAADVDVIVVPSGSCTAMVRDYWPHLFADDTEGESTIATAVSRTMELTEFLSEHAAEPLGPDRGPVVVYHQSCHMSRLLGLIDEPLGVVERSGYTPTSHAATGRCCGFGGLFSIKFPELSVAMADDVLDAMVDADAKTVTGCDLSCLMQLSSRARFRNIDIAFLHIAELAISDAPPKDPA